MRALIGVSLVLAVAAIGCTDTTLDGDTQYRRLAEQWDSEGECLENSLAPCYQTLTLCANGATSLDLDARPLRGSYVLDGEIARGNVIEMRFEFDLDSQSAPQLPGRRWELVEALTYDCASE
jgi:hypothetical protein